MQGREIYTKNLEEFNEEKRKLKKWLDEHDSANCVYYDLIKKIANVSETYESETEEQRGVTATEQDGLISTQDFTDITALVENRKLDLCAVNNACIALDKITTPNSWISPSNYLPNEVYSDLMTRANNNLRLESSGNELAIAGLLTMLAVISIILVNVFAAPIAMPITLGVLAATFIMDVGSYGHSQGWHHRLFSSGYKPEMSVAMNKLISGGEARDHTDRESIAQPDYQGR